jgi:hypothetical protein
MRAFFDRDHGQQGRVAPVLQLPNFELVVFATTDELIQ